MPLTPAPINPEKSSYYQKMEEAKKVEDPIERAEDILHIHQKFFNYACTAIGYMKESKYPQIAKLLTMQPSVETDNLIDALHQRLEHEKQTAERDFNHEISKRRQVTQIMGENFKFPDEEPGFDNALSNSVKADREFSCITTHLRQTVNGIDRAMNCNYDPTRTIMENFRTAKNWLDRKEKEFSLIQGPRMEVELPF